MSVITQPALDRPAAPRIRAAGRTRPRTRLKRANTLYKQVVALLFGFVMLLSVATQALNVAGVPVRAVVAAGLLGVLAANNRREMFAAFRRHKGFLLLTLAVGLIGLAASFIAQNDPLIIAKQVIEIHIQTAINLLLGAVVVEICGASTVIIALVAAIMLSAVFAVAQFVNIGIAWDIRDKIAQISGETGTNLQYDHTRPPGLSLSKITLATQMCLALAAVFVRQQRLMLSKGPSNRNEWLILIAVGVFSVTCLASGNRSPIIGGIAFYICYLVRNRPGLLLVLVPLMVIAIPAADLVLESLQSTGLRAFSTGDKSSEGRQTLIYYGWRLFCARPIGYGLGFDPRLLWETQWAYIQSMPNAIVVRSVELHNYALNMLNYYGITILVVVPFAATMIYRRRYLLLGFLPYCIHIVFHNYGPFQNDTLIMFVIAAAVGPIVEKAPRRVKRRRRTRSAPDSDPASSPLPSSSPPSGPTPALGPA